MKRALLVALVACGGEKREPPPAPPPAPKPVQKPTRIALGDCAPPDTQFESGPKPTDPARLIRPWQVPPVKPSLEVGTPKVVGSLDKLIVRRYVRRRIGRLAACYLDVQQDTPALAGDVKATYSIGPTGLPAEVTATGLDPRVAACVKDVLASVTYPQPKGGGTAKVEYVFTFKPPEPIEPDPDPPYFPDEHSPLREYKADLLACLTKPYGVGLVELGGGEPRVLGVEGEAATCIAAVAKRLPLGNLVEGLRCSFAYGTIPLHELPSIDVSTKLADVRPRVRALRSAAPVSIIGPIVVRAQPTTPMNVVAALVDEIYGTGRVDVIVTTGNTLPFAIDLPAVPIPDGTGTWWADGEYATLHVKVDGVRVNGLEVPRADVVTELGKQKIESIAISADAEVPLSDVMHVAGMAKVPWRIVAEPEN